MTKISFQVTAEKPWSVISRASKFGVIEKIISTDTIYSGIHYRSVSTQKFYTVGILVSKRTVLANKPYLFYSLKKMYCEISLFNRYWEQELKMEKPSCKHIQWKKNDFFPPSEPYFWASVNFYKLSCNRTVKANHIMIRHWIPSVKLPAPVGK